MTTTISITNKQNSKTVTTTKPLKVLMSTAVLHVVSIIIKIIIHKTTNNYNNCIILDIVVVGDCIVTEGDNIEVLHDDDDSATMKTKS